MDKIWSYCFDTWWRPILFFFLCAGVLVLDFFEFVSIPFAVLLFIASILVLAISAIYQAIKKRWLASVATALLAVTATVVGIFLAIAAYALSALGPDHWADDLEIPSGIPLEKPFALDNHLRTDSILQLDKTEQDFQLYASFQPGLYLYDFWIKDCPNGWIYLKAFEITKEYPLSVESLEQRTLLGVKEMKAGKGTRRVGMDSHFTIYEGDWEKPYAARFEVWFRPEDGGAERKLLSENYLIEGWMH